MFLSFLESLRLPIQTMTGLPDGAVNIYAQQSVEEVVANAIAQHNCSVLVALTGGSGSATYEAQTKTTTNTLEIEVWTPAVLTSGQELTTVAVAELIIAGLHGYKDPDRSSTSGAAQIPLFRRWALREERSREGDEYLVANLQFEVPLVPARLA